MGSPSRSPPWTPRRCRPSNDAAPAALYMRRNTILATVFCIHSLGFLGSWTDLASRLQIAAGMACTYGPQFLRNYTGKTVSLCCCSSPLCEKLGYSHGGMFRFPVKPEQVSEAARVLGLSPAERQRIVNNPRVFKISPWHYHALHCYRDNKGRWNIRKLPKYKDDDGKMLYFPPPNGNVQSFINEQCLVLAEECASRLKLQHELKVNGVTS